MNTYYNENDSFCCEWLRRLIARRLIAPGDVDGRSIAAVSADDVRGYTQCHWFAGLGGWSYALRLAGWPDDRPVWTGSAPCQPFSSAGRHGGVNDERHLFPVWARLIAHRRPPVVFGEQVPAAIGHGWLDLVASSLGAAGYTIGATVLGAHSVGAPHRRQRLYWVAHTTGMRHAGERGRGGGGAAQPGGVDDAMQRRHGPEDGPVRAGRDGAVGAGHECVADTMQRGLGEVGPTHVVHEALGDSSPWPYVVWLPCRNGKARAAPALAALFDVADGLPADVDRGCAAQGYLSPLTEDTTLDRVGILRAAGNAIVPQVAAEVVGAYMEVTT